MVKYKFHTNPSRGERWYKFKSNFVWAKPNRFNTRTAWSSWWMLVVALITIAEHRQTLIGPGPVSSFLPSRFFLFTVHEHLGSSPVRATPAIFTWECQAKYCSYPSWWDVSKIGMTTFLLDSNKAMRWKLSLVSQDSTWWR